MSKAKDASMSRKIALSLIAVIFAPGFINCAWAYENIPSELSTFRFALFTITLFFLPLIVLLALMLLYARTLGLKLLSIFAALWVGALLATYFFDLGPYLISAFQAILAIIIYCIVKFREICQDIKEV